ncbi:MAG: nicotinamidase [Enterovibrio sp.]
MIASIDVDPQRCFTPHCPNELPVIGGDALAPHLNLQASKAQFRVLSKDAHPANAVWVVENAQQMMAPLPFPNADTTWVAHAVPGTRGFELIDGLPAITDYDFVVWKGIEPDFHPYGACFHDLNGKLSTGLIEWLQAKKVTTVLVGGLATDYCVKVTALQLKQAGHFDVWVNLSACRAINQETEKSACAEMRKAGIHIINQLSEFTP